MSDPLELRGVARVYRGDAGGLPALRGADLTVRSGKSRRWLRRPGWANPPRCTSPASPIGLTTARCSSRGGMPASSPDAAAPLSARDTIGFVYQFPPSAGGILCPGECCPCRR